MATKNGNMPWEKAILKVLEDNKKAMHYRDIASDIVEKGLRSLENIGATPANTVNAIIHGPKLSGKVIPASKKGEYILQSVIEKDPSLVLTSINSKEEDEESEISDALITAYGRFWSREKWEQNNQKMYGTSFVTKNAPCVDFSAHAGIYLLHKGYEVIYVGQALKQPICKRLSDHTKDDKRNRWDNFSWFSIQDLECGLGDLEKKVLTPSALLDTIEALLIETLGLERNKKVGNVFENKEFEQVNEKDFLKFHFSHKK